MNKNFKSLVTALQQDSQLISRFLVSPEDVISEFNLSSEESSALLARDIPALNKLGLTTGKAVGALSGAHSQRCHYPA
ncbi:MAG: hypothetical protein LKI94_01910 [Sporolactobacillus sp.]|nr:hypothetical protein [Sporolactobacillus sp.]